jgi:hypothetical protein
VLELTSPAATRYLWEYRHPNNPAICGHSWLVVPPFEIVDLTIGFQRPDRLTDAQVAATPSTFLGENGDPVVATFDELAEPELKALRRERRLPLTIAAMAPELSTFWEGFPPKRYPINGLALKYIPCKVTASEAQNLDDIRNVVLSGRDSRALATEFIARFPPARR